MAELARGDSAISKTFSQNWKWSHLIAAGLQRRAEGALPAAVRGRSPLPARQGHHRADRRLRQPHAAGGRAQGRPEAARRAPGRRMDPQRREVLHRQRQVGKLFFIDARTDPNAPLRQGTTMFLVPRDTPGFRIGKVFNKSGWRFYQNGEMIFENARVPHANVVGEVNSSDMKTQRGGRPHRRRPVRRSRTRRQRARRLRRRLRAGDEARQDREAGRPAADRAAARRSSSSTR